MFRFSIRDVLWLTALVALSVGWWLDRRNVDKLRLEREAMRIERDHFRESEARYFTAFSRLHPARQPRAATPNRP